MKINFFTLCTILVFLSICSHAQSGKSTTHSVNDSAKKEQSGKADVYVMGKPVFDAEAIQKEKTSATGQIKKKSGREKATSKKKAKRKIITKRS